MRNECEMHNKYDDITSIAGEPKWWDEFAVPRYCEFSPDRVANIYASEVVLLEIACQNCGQRFQAAMSRDSLDIYEHGTLAGEVRRNTIHYGDPPNIGCCPAGPTMNCVDLGVNEYWVRRDTEWIRDIAFETLLTDRA